MKFFFSNQNSILSIAINRFIVIQGRISLTKAVCHSHSDHIPCTVTVSQAELILHLTFV